VRIVLIALGLSSIWVAFTKDEKLGWPEDKAETFWLVGMGVTMLALATQV